MIQSIYQSAAAVDGLQTWNDVIARNIASASAPGFKRDAMSFEGVASGMLEFGSGAQGPYQMSGIAPMVGGNTNFAAGEIRATGDDFEFAIEGSGFFRLQRPDGQFIYTRDGQFHASPEGQLVSKQGFPVLGESGPVQLLIEGGPMSVDPDGRVWQSGQEVGSLTAYQFNDPANLLRAPGGFVVDPESGDAARPAENARVRQGFIESSNVSPIREMVDMVTVSNALQANQRIIQTLDELSQRAVQVLGNAS